MTVFNICKLFLFYNYIDLDKICMSHHKKPTVVELGYHLINSVNYLSQITSEMEHPPVLCQVGEESRASRDYSEPTIA